MERIATDTYSFERVREGGFVYVDKTAILKTLADGSLGTQFFIARPRRFGKSLAVSTLQCLFEGRRDLFRGLAICAETANRFSSTPRPRWRGCRAWRLRCAASPPRRSMRWGNLAGEQSMRPSSVDRRFSCVDGSAARVAAGPAPGPFGRPAPSPPYA